MIIPIVASISRDLFLSVPRELQDGAAALGATRWEVVRGVVLPSTASGVMAASLLGLGRALGEAIAVAQVIGAGTEIHASLFRTGDTLAARIANQFPGAITQLHTGLALLPRRDPAGDRPGLEPGRAVDRPSLRRRPAGGGAVSEPLEPIGHGYEEPAFDPTAPLTATGNLRRRQLVSRVAEGGATTAAVLAVAVLVIVVWAVVVARRRGAQPRLPAQGRTGRDRPGAGRHRRDRPRGDPDRDADRGARRPLHDRVRQRPARRDDPARPRPDERAAVDHRRPVRLRPARRRGKQQSGFAASIALAIIMVPLIARGSQEVLLLVPNNLREAADALGVSRWRTVLTVILPSAVGRHRHRDRPRPGPRRRGDRAADPGHVGVRRQRRSRSTRSKRCPTSR